ncbi:MAG: epoxyqueuosine reductase QueH [Oscillospiraceae bacterium]|nr:epoxyqueuosine reductase QueH [Oscillospiraceae bacterium]
MNINYRKDLARLLQEVSALPEKPKLLLHACCGPCAAPVLERLSPYFRLTILYYNPNTAPEAEFLRRLAAVKTIAAAQPEPVPVIVPEYRPEEFYAPAAGMEHLPEGGKRCLLCWELRLRETALQAAKLGFPWFGSTLTVGPTKNARIINPMGDALAKETGLRWLTADFKKDGGYDRARILSQQYGLYRQDFCGCTPSYLEAHPNLK